MKPGTTSSLNRFSPLPLFLAAAVFILCSPVFWISIESPDDTRPARSTENSLLFQQVYPAMHYGYHRLAQGDIPLWNNQQLCGAPFFADPRNALFQPLNIIFLFMETTRAMALHAFIALSLMGFFFVLYMRSMNLRYLPSVLGGLMYMCCGATAAVMSNPGYVSALVWLPLLCLIIREYTLRRPRPALAVIDLNVASPAGLGLAERLSAQGLPAVVLVPTGQIEAMRRCYQIGISHCLSKPVKPAELLEAVAAVLGAGPAHADREDNRVHRVQRPALSVLVADDSPINQEVAAGLLEISGHRVRAVCDGDKAVRAFEEEPFDVILMDVEMPEMDGLAATAAIRRIEQSGGRARTPIVAMTAHAIKDVRDRCFAAGMDSYVSKPIRPDELLAELEAVTRGKAP